MDASTAPAGCPREDRVHRRRASRRSRAPAASPLPGRSRCRSPAPPTRNPSARSTIRSSKELRSVGECFAMQTAMRSRCLVPSHAAQRAPQALTTRRAIRERIEQIPDSARTPRLRRSDAQHRSRGQAMAVRWIAGRRMLSIHIGIRAEKTSRRGLIAPRLEVRILKSIATTAGAPGEPRRGWRACCGCHLRLQVDRAVRRPSATASPCGSPGSGRQVDEVSGVAQGVGGEGLPVGIEGRACAGCAWPSHWPSGDAAAARVRSCRGYRFRVQHGATRPQPRRRRRRSAPSAGSSLHGRRAPSRPWWTMYTAPSGRHEAGPPRPAGRRDTRP